MRYCPERLARSDDVAKALARQPAFLEICHSDRVLPLVPALRNLAPRTRLIGVVGHVDGVDLFERDTLSLLSCGDWIRFASRGLDHLIHYGGYDAIGGLAQLEELLRSAYADRFQEAMWVSMLAPRLATLRDHPLQLWDDGLSLTIRKLALRLKAPVAIA